MIGEEKRLTNSTKNDTLASSACRQHLWDRMENLHRVERLGRKERPNVSLPGSWTVWNSHGTSTPQLISMDFTCANPPLVRCPNDQTLPVLRASQNSYGGNYPPRRCSQPGLSTPQTSVPAADRRCLAAAAMPQSLPAPSATRALCAEQKFAACSSADPVG